MFVNLTTYLEFKAMTNKQLPFITTFFILLLSFNTLQAQNTPQKVLGSGDVTKFIKTFDPMTQEFKQLEMDFEKDPNAAANAIAGNEKAMAILKKYGWDEEYFLKVGTIAMSYSICAMEEEFKKLPPEQAQYAAQVKEGYLKQVNPSDLELVKSNFSELKRILDK